MGHHIASCAIVLAVLAAPSLQAAQRPIYATWIMVWDGHDQSHWWQPDNYMGAKVLGAGGKWASIDWANDADVRYYLDAIADAGINVLVADLTNGWGWLDTRCQMIQGLCARRGLKFCVAENSHGSPAEFEQHAADVWAKLAGPQAPHGDTYFLYHGKPLIVCYCVRSQFRTIRESTGPARAHFNVVWASGEDSEKNKWGWQLEPWVGGIPSTDSMFVTPSVRWNPSKPDLWRKSLAWLDYNFALARRSGARHIIVGSYDDISERNSWLVADTSGCARCFQTRDKTGALSATAYYDRVRQWIAGHPEVTPGGVLPDGCYRIINRATGKALCDHGASGKVGSAVVQWAPEKGLTDYIWIYHLGRDAYRLVALTAGLSIGAQRDGDGVDTEWDDRTPRQMWTLGFVRDGYVIRNDLTGKVLAVAGGSHDDGAAVVQVPASGGRAEEWSFDPILTLDGK